MGNNKAIRHGEVMLVPVKKVPVAYTQVFKTVDYMVGYSAAGHHHVLESTTEFEVISDQDKKDLFFRLIKPAKLVHRKTTDRHKDLVVPAGLYQRFNDTEYSPFDEIIRDVAD